MTLLTMSPQKLAAEYRFVYAQHAKHPTLSSAQNLKRLAAAFHAAKEEKRATRR